MSSFYFGLLLISLCGFHWAVGRFCIHVQTRMNLKLAYLLVSLIIVTIPVLFTKEGWIEKLGFDPDIISVVAIILSLGFITFQFVKTMEKFE